MRCDFHVEGSRQRWSDRVDALPELGADVEHRGKRYVVVDLVTSAGWGSGAGADGDGVVIVTVRRRLDEPALV